MSLFVCFVVLHISKEDAKIIPAAVEHTIHIDIVVKNSVKSEVTAGHQETIVTLDIGNRGQGRANQTVLPLRMSFVMFRTVEIATLGFSKFFAI